MNGSVEIGAVLASKYRVERVLGAGAMGIVVAARHMQLGSLVALKFMLPEATNVQGASDRFIREARAAARLRGEHVARVLDFGTLETGAPYIVMEFLEGSDLDELLRVRGPLPVAEALGYVLDVCKAMDEAHQAGIVHRDLKPKNLFVTHRHDGTTLIKVLDFGISKLSDGSDDFQAAATRTGSILGSPAFMPPEQIKSAKYVDARADIYALGAVLYYLLVQDYPFDAGSIGELLGSILYKEPRPLRTCRPDAPLALEAVVTRCMQKDPDARFSNVKELSSALQSVLESVRAGASTKVTAAETLISSPEEAPFAPPRASWAGDSKPASPAHLSYPSNPEPAVRTTMGASMSTQSAVPRASKSWLVLALCGLGLLVIGVAITTGVLFLRGHRDAAASAPKIDVPAASTAIAAEPLPPEPAAASASPPPAPPQSDKPDASVSENALPHDAPHGHGEGKPKKSKSAPSPASSLGHGGMYDR